jgi:hypothetical protein
MMFYLMIMKKKEQLDIIIVYFFSIKWPKHNFRFILSLFLFYDSILSKYL